MKKKLLLIIIMLLTLSMTACNKKKEKEEDKPVIKQEEKVKISERKQKIINLVKAEMISENHIITENISTLDILKVYVYGYDKKTGQKDIEIDFTYTCQTEDNCIKGLNSEPNKNNTIMINMDSEETKINSINTGISISANEINNGEYIRTNELVE